MCTLCMCLALLQADTSTPLPGSIQSSAKDDNLDREGEDRQRGYLLAVSDKEEEAGRNQEDQTNLQYQDVSQEKGKLPQTAIK